MGVVFLVLCVLPVFQLFSSEEVRAGVYDDAYSYYQRYGNEMAFLPGDDNKGEIYYATQAKKNEHTGIKYMTLGWKIRLFNGEGALVETLYYKLGGNHMKSVDVCTVNGYEYCLYRVSLADIKQRLSAAGKRTLENPNCNIIFDACTTTKLNGVVQGGMTDDGPVWGKVYTTYNGIVNAQKWSNATKQTLKSYYNKNVVGLFYEVRLEKTTGISSVHGEGRYCFGTLVTVSAETEEGYHFSHWNGTSAASTESYSFEIGGRDESLTAYAKENSYLIKYESNEGAGGIPVQKTSYSHHIMMPKDGFQMQDAALSGWILSDAKEEHYFLCDQQVAVKELVHLLDLQGENGATLVLQAVWDHGPRIIAEHIYVSKQDALAGYITEDWLAHRAQAIDAEDGEIAYGRNEKTAFYIENYEPSHYTEVQAEGIIEATFFASDSAGNTTQKKIEVYIVDTGMYPEDKFIGKVRFISKKYYKDDNGNLISEIMGGLTEDSIWRLNEEYRRLLEQLFS